jgi:hypothetical protein
MNDLVSLAMFRATEKFGGTDGIFNAACFSAEFRRLAGVDGLLDGRVVQAILCGRSDVVPLKGGAHYRHVQPG